MTVKKNKQFFIVVNNTISKQSVSNRSMSQFERVNVSLEVEGEGVKLNYRIVKMKPKLPFRPASKVGTEAGEFVITRGPKGQTVSAVRVG